MNSEIKNSEQGKKETLMRVPELRFPEFCDEKEWQEKQLQSICQMKAGKFISASKINQHPAEGLYPCYGGNGLRGFTGEYSHSGEYSLIGRQGALCGNITFANGDFYATEHAVVVTPSNGVNNNWLFYCLNKLKLNQYAIGQAQPGLSVNFIEKIIVQIPSKEKEQKKIADCLSSLDKVISLQTQKIDTLQQYKKGLMQKLFPAEGEVVPELRFSEFRNESSWEEKKLSDVSPSIFDGTHQTPSYKREGIPFFSVENIVSGKENKFISKDDFISSTKKNKPEKGDVLLTRIGKIGFSKVVDWDYDFSIYVTLAVIKKSKLFDSFYLHYFMQSNRYQAEIHAKSLLNAVPCKTNMDSLRNTLILLPTLNEQQKIADCLSSLDNLIAAESQKLTALKTHKIGMMQQLFPSMDEVTA
ncbi:restriction endonuclease subunit S [Yersinia enterocolitica]|uniref:restriction endonuclease subunit S n=1 Tax=Yersinia enterocolitica TaxID=630 RepID=UPI001C8DBAA1|nr:restriction endonuclease subunit S [Yersinia enterocolitica]MBX9486037.1 restriction endonuclease subunit S [Yersinia enterocolitica]MBX9491485.1 restriction endonuclease subunit S [Yersinia enterocolitica]HDL7177313.1 restriction endonuclease subunit S [Yersinia enterocolitica]HDL7320736.1 restriction endonuclease subunit S [Yersinia enterocolitica]HDL7447248.1 restriction endonuclease subunit S [Yersinia enterocolitica]